MCTEAYLPMPQRHPELKWERLLLCPVWNCGILDEDHFHNYWVLHRYWPSQVPGLLYTMKGRSIAGMVHHRHRTSRYALACRFGEYSNSALIKSDQECFVNIDPFPPEPPLVMKPARFGDTDGFRTRVIPSTLLQLIPSSGGLSDLPELVSECASGDLVDQSPRGDLRAIGAHRGGDGAGTGRHVRLEGVAERLGQRVGSGAPGACAIPIPRSWTLFAQ